MAVTNIGLRISGTKQRQAGFAPLANAGVLAGGEGDNMDRVPLIAESPAYVIKHAAEYILYLLIDRRVRSFDADAPGVLSIALTIPSNSQLKDDKSPYTLLKEVYNAFVSNFMEQASDGRNTFLNVDSRESTIFRDIVANYSLEARRSAYVTMNPAGISGVVCVSESDMEDFFRNTQYKEFATFKDIEVGSLCYGQVTPGLERLQIPLPPASYEVWVNGNKTGKTMASPSDKYYVPEESNKYYTYDSLEFSFGELLGAPNGQLQKKDSQIVLDTANNRISCTLKKKDIFYDLVVDWKEIEYGGKAAIERYAKKGDVCLKLENQDITDILYSSQGLLSYKAKEVIGKKISIMPKIIGNYSMEVSSTIDENNRQVVIIVSVDKNSKPATSGYHPPIMGKTNRITNGNNPIDDPNYFKKGNRTEETPSQPNQKKGMIDLKSFGLGVVVGLLLGLAIWFLIGLIGGDEKKGSDKKVESKSEEAVYPAYAASNEQPDSSVEEKAGDIIEPIGEKKNNDVSLGDATPTPAKSETSSEKTGATGETENIANINVAKATIATMIKNGERKLDNIKKTDAYKQLKNGDRLIVSRIVDPKNGLGPNYKDYFEKSDLGLIKTMVNNAPISDWQDIVTLSQNIEETLKDIVRGKGGSIK